MARVAKQTEHTPRTITGLLSRWESIELSGTNVYPGQTPLDYALPASKEAFTPNAHLMYLLIKTLGGSIRQHFAGSGANYNSFMSMYSRWKKDSADLADTTARYKAAKNVQALASEEYIKARDDLLLDVAGWVSYESWLRMLGKARVLSAPVINAVPQHDRRSRDALLRMSREWAALEDVGIEDVPASVGESLPTVEIKLGVRRGVAMPDSLLAAVTAVPAVTGADIDGMAAKNDVFTGYNIAGDIREALTGRVFVNCVFNDVTFRGDMTGVTFILCDFMGDCKIATGTGADGLTFKNCGTDGGELGLANLTLTGLRMYQCDGMKVNIRRSGVTNSHITDGWIDCGRAAVDADDLDAPRIAPRTVAGAQWQNGGLDFDLRSIPLAEVNANTSESLVLAVVPAAMRVCMVRYDGVIDSCSAAAEVMLADQLLSTRTVASHEWEVVTSDEAREVMEEESRRRAQRRTPRTVQADPAPRPENSTADLERAFFGDS